MDTPNPSAMTNKKVLITGGAGHLGQAMASGFARAGAGGIIVDRSAKAAAATARRYADETGAQWFGIECDLEDEGARADLAVRTLALAGPIDVLVNCAAFVGDSSLQGWATDFAEQSVETWRRALEVNLTAPFHLAQLYAEQLARDKFGAIVNVASIYGVVGPDLGLYEGTSMGNPAAYAASKGGLVQLTRWLSTVLAPDIRVNCISPGGIARGQDPQFAEKYIARTPMARMGNEDDIVGAATYLASDAASWVTGQNLVIDGGYTSW